MTYDNPSTSGYTASDKVMDCIRLGLSARFASWCVEGKCDSSRNVGWRSLLFVPASYMIFTVHVGSGCAHGRQSQWSPRPILRSSQTRCRTNTNPATQARHCCELIAQDCKMPMMSQGRETDRPGYHLITDSRSHRRGKIIKQMMIYLQSWWIVRARRIPIPFTCSFMGRHLYGLPYQLSSSLYQR